MSGIDQNEIPSSIAREAEVVAIKFYEMGGGFVGNSQASEIVMKFVATRLMTVSAVNSLHQGHAETASVATAIYPIHKEAAGSTAPVPLGTMTFSAGVKEAAFSITANATDLTLHPGDKLYAVGPASPDSALADVAFTLVAAVS
jgi:hypothetical protein